MYGCDKRAQHTIQEKRSVQHQPVQFQHDIALKQRQLQSFNHCVYRK